MKTVIALTLAVNIEHLPDRPKRDSGFFPLTDKAIEEAILRKVEATPTLLNPSDEPETP